MEFAGFLIWSSNGFRSRRSLSSLMSLISLSLSLSIFVFKWIFESFVVCGCWVWFGGRDWMRQRLVDFCWFLIEIEMGKDCWPVLEKNKQWRVRRRKVLGCFKRWWRRRKGLFGCDGGHRICEEGWSSSEFWGKQRFLARRIRLNAVSIDFWC